MKIMRTLAALLLAAEFLVGPAAAADIEVSIDVDARQRGTPLHADLALLRRRRA